MNIYFHINDVIFSIFQEFQPLGVERAALNIIASRCISDHLAGASRNPEDLIENYVLIEGIYNNLKYISSLQNEDGGFGTIHATALAVTAEIAEEGLTPFEPQPFITPKALDWLVAAQNADGSFGSSVTFTSLALTALHQSEVRFLSILQCHEIYGKPVDDFEIRIAITDTLFARQTFYDRVPVKTGELLSDVLEAYAKANPKSLKLVTEDRFGYIFIQSINGLENRDDAGFEWKVYKFPDDDLMVDSETIKELEGIKTPVEKGFTYKIIYQ